MREGRFLNRQEGGIMLAKELRRYDHDENAIVLGLPRGGLPVAYEVARVLHLPLDIFLVRKLGVPGHEEMAMGAIASGGVRVLNADVVRQLRIDRKSLDNVSKKEQRELQRREKAYRGERPRPALKGRTAILVDDGLATGATMRAAIKSLRQHNPARIVVAVPTAAPSTCDELADEVDELVYVIAPEPFMAVGVWYEDFPQTSDDEVRDILQRAARNRIGA